MINNFQINGEAVLTTKEPGAFLNFETVTPSETQFLIPEQSSDISIGMLYVNGLDISKEASIYDDSSLGFYVKLDYDNNIKRASLFVYADVLYDFDSTLKINVYDTSANIGGSPYDTISLRILNRPDIISSESINVYETSNVQIDDETSYMILRTNPKFSGNVKLAIDPSNNLFLDTFKISDILSNKLYRKQSVSASSILSGDIRQIFSSLPLEELYKVGNTDTKNISLPKTDLFNQYETEYSYGAKLFKDELYEEDFSMLAPLWLNNKVPDYFAIFRLPGVKNEETYTQSSTLDNLANKFLEQGEIVESWGMKEKAPLGSYLRNHLSELSQVISPMFLSLSDPKSIDPDPNTWYGMAIDKGVITGRSETTYRFDQNSKNFTDLNHFSSQGFERLNLLCPNLINMEYEFNDKDVSLYTMNRYFGLYLTENPLYSISYYAPTPDSSIQVLSLDGKNSMDFFDSSIFDSSGNISSNYKNRLLTLDDLLSIQRIQNKYQINGSEKEPISEYLNKEGDNIFTTRHNKIENIGQFITFELKNSLNPGETLRFIDEHNFKIWEINGINDEVLEAGEALSYASIYESDEYPTVHRTSFSIKGSLEEQNMAIWNAWAVFQDYENTPFEYYIRKERSQSLRIKDKYNEISFKFQRITSQTENTPSGAGNVFNNSACFDDIIFYKTLNPSIEDFSVIQYDASYGPINFEIFGSRLSLVIDIINPIASHVYSLDKKYIFEFEDNMLYLAQDKWNRLIQYIDISTNKNHSLRYIEDPTSLNDEILIFTEMPIFKMNDFWNAYSVYPLTISLMGINPVKDLDYTVYDSSTLNTKSDYWYKRDGDVSTNKFFVDASTTKVLSIRDSYHIESGNGTISIENNAKTYIASNDFNTFTGSATIQANTNTIITRHDMDASGNFKSYNPNFSEENICDYYNGCDASTITTNGKKSLKYGLTIPTITKWVGTGPDCRNNPFRLMLNSDLLSDVSSNFIPFNDDFTKEFDGELFYPSFKYLSGGERNWKDYIFNDINDSIKYTSNNEEYVSLKQLMFKEPNIDVFSKIIYSNNKTKGTALRSSIVYYNNYKQSLDVILSGLNLSINVNEIAKNMLDIKEWNRYRISAISVASRNKDSNNVLEFIINENTKTILIIWYQGNDILNYNYRNADVQMGKSLLDPSEVISGPIQWKSFNHNDPKYDYVKTPFAVNTASLSSNIFNIYGIESTYDDEVANQFNQMTLNYKDELFSIFNAFQDISINGSNMNYHGDSYNTFDQYVNYAYVKSNSTFGNDIVNLPYTYNYNKNIYKNSTCDLDTFKYLIKHNNIAYYILKDNDVIKSSNFLEPPISISINEPRSYNNVVTYNGWYKPNFNNILNFSYNEDEYLINIVKLDFTLSNTNLESYDNIKQLWFNKVVDNITEFDVSIANAIDYQKEYNPFLSQWDKNYYTTYDDSLIGHKVDGYNSTLELPAFFGSKLIQMPNSLKINKWDRITAKVEENVSFSNHRPGNSNSINSSFNDLTLSYNLTKSIINIFKNSDEFIDNWAGITQSTNVINEYIKKTIVDYYSISRNKLKVIVWVKKSERRVSNHDRIVYEWDDSFKLLEGDNIDSRLVYNNDEYIYMVDILRYPNVQYFIEFVLFEK